MVFYRAPSQSFVLTEWERQSFTFFLDQTRYRFPIDFSNSVLQAAQQNQALAHSILSLGALQQLFEHVDGPPLKTDFGQFAAQQYGKALRALQIRNKPQSADTLMICSILFTCFECLRGCRRAAMIHIKCGLDLFRSSRAQATWNIVSEKTISILFIRLENQLLEILGVDMDQEGYCPAPLAELSTEQSSDFGDNNLRNSLDGLLNHVFHDTLNSFMMTESQVPLMSPGRSSQISSSIDGWNCDFLRSTAQSLRLQRTQQHLSECCDRSGEDRDLLRIWCLLSKIYIAMQPYVDTEEAWDQFVADFDTVVTLSESYLNRSRFAKLHPHKPMCLSNDNNCYVREYTRKRTFTFSLGVVPALFITCIRCRKTSIRRRALQLLTECNRAELIWDSFLASEAAKRVIEIEESSSWLNTIDHDENGLIGPRIRTVKVLADDENGAKFELESTYL
jgi:Fungal specific transcription factor domain